MSFAGLDGVTLEGETLGLGDKADVIAVAASVSN